MPIYASEVRVDFRLTSPFTADKPTAKCVGCGQELRPDYDGHEDNPESPEFWELHDVLTCLGVFRDEFSRVSK